jgi:hypothetical protein
MVCQKCSSDHIASVMAKCSDMCSYVFQGKEHVGYVPSEVGIGGGDYVDFEYCLECGQIQWQFPVEYKYKGKER